MPKITALPAAASVTADDLVAIVDSPNTTAVTQKATIGQIAAAVTTSISSLPTGTPAVSDLLVSQQGAVTQNYTVSSLLGLVPTVIAGSTFTTLTGGTVGLPNAVITTPNSSSATISPSLTISTGSNSSTGNVGALNFVGGTTVSATATGWAWVANSCSGTGSGGSWTIRGGAAGSVSGTGGAVVVIAGTPQNGAGGAVTVKGSNAVASSVAGVAGGQANITGGNGAGTSSTSSLARGGDVLITAGDALVGSTAARSGFVRITAGTGPVMGVISGARDSSIILTPGQYTTSPNNPGTVSVEGGLQVTGPMYLTPSTDDGATSPYALTVGSYSTYILQFASLATATINLTLPSSYEFTNSYQTGITDGYSFKVIVTGVSGTTTVNVTLGTFDTTPTSQVIVPAGGSFTVSGNTSFTLTYTTSTTSGVGTWYRS